MKQSLTISAVPAGIIILGLFCDNAGAHHGVAAHFAMDEEVLVHGVLSEIRIVNPHSYVYFDVEGADGMKESWRCEMNGASALRGNGLNEALFVPGESISVTGNPARREARVCYVQQIEFSGGTTMARDGVTNVASAAPQRSATVNRTIDPGRGLYDHWVAFRIPGSRGRPAMSASDVAGIENSHHPLPTPRPPIALTSAGETAAERFDIVYDMPALRCEPNVISGMYHNTLPNKFELMDSDRIRLTYGYMDLERIINLNADLPGDLAPSLSGYSMGRWEGGTLVVDTTGFLQQPFFADRDAATMSSEQLRLQERFTIDAEFDHLVVEYRAEDPLFWSAPIGGIFRLRRSPASYEPYDCVELSGDNNRR